MAGMKATVLVLLSALAPTTIKPQTSPAPNSTNASSLQASITASPLTDGSYGIEFRLKNETQKEVACEPETWQLIIDGKVYANSGMLFSNGPAPPGGYATLKPEGEFVFGKGLLLSEFFPEDRDYKVSWLGAGFESNTVIVHGLVRAH
jgi:hypothetical protein